MVTTPEPVSLLSRPAFLDVETVMRVIVNNECLTSEAHDKILWTGQSIIKIEYQGNSALTTFSRWQMWIQASSSVFNANL